MPLYLDAELLKLEWQEWPPPWAPHSARNLILKNLSLTTFASRVMPIVLDGHWKEPWCLGMFLYILLTSTILWVLLQVYTMGKGMHVLLKESPEGWASLDSSCWSEVFLYVTYKLKLGWKLEIQTKFFRCQHFSSLEIRLVMTFASPAEFVQLLIHTSSQCPKKKGMNVTLPLLGHLPRSKPRTRMSQASLLSVGLKDEAQDAYEVWRMFSDNSRGLRDLSELLCPTSKEWGPEKRGLTYSHIHRARLGQNPSQASPGLYFPSLFQVSQSTSY